MPPLSAKTRWTYWGGDIENLPQGINPPILNRSYTITADVEIPDGGAEGVVVAAFDHLGGYSLLVMDNKLHHTYSFMGVQTYQHESDKPLPTGRVRLRLDFEADAPVMAPGGTVSLFANDEPIGSGRMDHTVPILFTAYAGLDIGRDNGEVVDIRYEDKAPLPSPAPSTRSPRTSDPEPNRQRGAPPGPNRRQPGPPHRVLLNLSRGPCQARSKSEWGTSTCGQLPPAPDRPGVPRARSTLPRQPGPRRWTHPPGHRRRPSPAPAHLCHGKVKVADKHEQSTRHGAWKGLAIGALTAILPGIGLGVGAAVGAGIGAVTGHIKGGMRNDDLRQLGAVLDKGQAGLIVLYATNMADQIAANITAEDRYVSAAIDADADELAKQLQATEGN